MILNAGDKWTNGKTYFVAYFCIIVSAVILTGASITFLFLSFYKDRIVNNIVWTTRSYMLMPCVAGLSLVAAIWIPLNTKGELYIN